VESMSKEILGHERMFEGSMIVNERYRDAIYDETGLLYTKLAISNWKKDPEKSKAYAEESLGYIRKKLTQQQNEIKNTLEKLEVILETIKEQREIDIGEGRIEIQKLSDRINERLSSARAEYLQTLKTH